MTPPEKAAILHACLNGRYVSRAIDSQPTMIQISLAAWDNAEDYFKLQMSPNERAVALSVVRAIDDERWTKLESEILPLSLKAAASKLITYENYLEDQGIPNIRLDDEIPPYSSFDVETTTAYGMYGGVVKDHGKSFWCNCGNPEMGFGCTCEWVARNPGNTDFTCQFCGLYTASRARCNFCEDCTPCTHPEGRLESIGPSNKNGLPLLKCLSCGSQMYGHSNGES